MSDFPGYPSPYSTWNQFTSARATFPVGNLPIPGLVNGVSNFQTSAYFPFGLSSLADPLPPLVSSSYRTLPLPAIPTRLLSGLGDVPNIGLEPSYGCSLQEPRALLHSPNFVFSQNPSPLTFDQVYRSSGCSSVSPVSQYRSQFDQRCVNSRLLLTGRLSEPLTREPSKGNISGTAKGGYEHFSASANTSVKKIEEKSEAKPAPTNQTRQAKIWNPFESAISKPDKQKEESESKSDFSIDSLTKTSSERQCANEKKSAVDANGNTLTKGVYENEIKALPKQPIPQYPIKPIPVYDNQILTFNTVGHKSRDDFYPTTSPLTKLSHISSKHLPQTSQVSFVKSEQHRSDACKSKHNSSRNYKELKCDSKDTDIVILIEDESDSSKPDVKVTSDVNQNSEISKNCNLEKSLSSDTKVKESESAEEKPTGENPVSETADKLKLGESVCQDNSDNVKETVSVDKVQDPSKADVTAVLGSESDNLYEEDRISFVEFLCPNVETQPSVINDYDAYGSQVSYFCPELKQTNEGLTDADDFTNEISKTTDENNTKSAERKVELNLKIKIPDQSKDKSKPSDVKSPLCSPNTREKVQRLKASVHSKCSKISKKDELSALSSQVNEIRNRRNSINKDRDGTRILSPSCELVEEPNFNAPCQSFTKDFIQHARTGRRRRMSAGGSTVTMLKSTEDSLSASISSSHVSESDSDTQMSNENAEKLFTESQSPNTQDIYQPTNNAESRSYMPTDNGGNISCGGQYYKTNNTPMCQTVTDNQKPYHCVQDQSRFNEKPDLMPQYSCYTPNQSTNVLPDSGNYQSQDEESSSYPQPSQPLDHTLDSSVDYDENSMMSEPHGVEPECDSQHSVSQSAEPQHSKANSATAESMNNTRSFITESEQALQWEFIHSKQYIDNIYCNQIGCEAVKLEDNIRDSDSPKTFFDLDKTTEEKKKQEMAKKDFCNSKHFGGKGFPRAGYPGYQRQNHSSYGNQSYDMYGSGSGNRWHSFTNQSKMASENDGGHYEQNQNHFRNNFQSGYSSMNQGQNGGDKTYNQSGFHGNEYSQNESNYYNQNQSMKSYQGNYGNGGRYDGSYYQNKGSNDFNSHNNMYPPNSGDVGSRYSGQGYAGGQGGYGQHYNAQSPSHSNMMGQYQNNSNQNFNIPRNASPASTGSEFTSMEPVKKKRGRKRKVEKEAQEENKPRPNTIVTAPTSIGPLIDVDNPDCPIETYDYNNQIETIFNFSIEDDLSPIGAQFLDIEKRVCQKLMPIKYGHPVNVIYNPLTYAFQTHRDFVSKFCSSEKTILFLGMNPGPYGMSQNGVPFGEATSVREWLKIQGDIYKPEIEHPKKPVTGLACTRNEVSGARFWGLFQKICRIPENFFRHCFVYNFCPLAYMSESGKNITPPQLVHTELDQINECCDVGLVELVKLLNIRIIISVGKFVQQRASKALHNAGVMNIKVECILHPSPINPHANKGWEQIVAKQLIEMNVMQYLNPNMEEVQQQIDEWEKTAQTNVKLAEPE